MRRSLAVDGYGLRFEAHRTDGKCPSVVAVDAKLTLYVAHHSHMMALIHGARQGYGISVCVYHLARNLLLGVHGHHAHNQIYDAK